MYLNFNLYLLPTQSMLVSRLSVLHRHMMINEFDIIEERWQEGGTGPPPIYLYLFAKLHPTRCAVYGRRSNCCAAVAGENQALPIPVFLLHTTPGQTYKHSNTSRRGKANPPRLSISASANVGRRREAGGKTPRNEKFVLHNNSILGGKERSKSTGGSSGTHRRKRQPVGSKKEVNTTLSLQRSTRRLNILLVWCCSKAPPPSSPPRARKEHVPRCGVILACYLFLLLAVCFCSTRCLQRWVWRGGSRGSALWLPNGSRCSVKPVK